MDQELLMSRASVKRGKESTDTIGALTHTFLTLRTLLMKFTMFKLFIVGDYIIQRPNYPRWHDEIDTMDAHLRNYLRILILNTPGSAQHHTQLTLSLRAVFDEHEWLHERWVGKFENFHHTQIFFRNNWHIDIRVNRLILCSLAYTICQLVIIFILRLLFNCKSKTL